MNKDNIIHAVPRIHTETKTSAKTGNQYNQIIITFSNGYKYAGFLSDEQIKLIEYAVKEAPVQNMFTNELQPPYQPSQPHMQ